MGKFRGYWQNLPGGTRGYLQINKTPNSFRGHTTNMSNGDGCTFEGVITNGKSLSGHYYCRQGDQDTISGEIVFGY